MKESKIALHFKRKVREKEARYRMEKNSLDECDFSAKSCQSQNTLLDFAALWKELCHISSLTIQWKGKGTMKI